MGSGQSKPSSATYEGPKKESIKQHLAILGLQGAGKSTVVKQFTKTLGEEEISPRDMNLVKADILKAVLSMTKFVLNHVIESLNAEQQESVIFERMYDELCEREDGLPDSSSQPLSTALDVVDSIVNMISSIWHQHAMKKIGEDEKKLMQLQETVPSGEKEQLFLSGRSFFKRIKEVMAENYSLSHDDYTHTRTWTRECKEYKLAHKSIPGKFAIRDVGGDELNRHHWSKSIEGSLCCMFIVSLSEYTKKSESTGEAKFREVKRILWQLADGEIVGATGCRPKIILILNKQDLFRKMLTSKLYPLHKSCEVFKMRSPQGEDESDDDYVGRCEKDVTDYFLSMPASLKEKYRSDSTLVKPTISGHHLSCATDQELFKNIIGRVVSALREILNKGLNDVGL